MHRKLIANSKSLFLLALTIFCASLAANAQSPTCSLKVDQLSPVLDLYGLRIHMSQEEVKQALPLVQFGRTDGVGVMRTSFNPHFDPRVDPAAFPDVRTISLDFLDGKLATLWIGYEGTFKWPKLEQFIANYSKALGVP